jgi:membrane-associated phospholipid phosphatase
MHWLVALTEFGDIAVLIPLAAVMLVWLLVAGSPHAAVWWTIAVIFCVAVTAFLKVFFFACSPTPDLRSPSGHTSLSTLVYGAVTLVAAGEATGARRAAALGLGAGFILAIAGSRLVLHTHSGLEVVLGLAIGFAALGLFGRNYRRYGAGRMRLPLLFASSAAMMLLLHGHVLHSEALFRGIAGYLQISCG